MGKTIKFEDENGVQYKTPIIRDSGEIFRRPSVLTPDDDYDRNRRNFGELILTKKKKNNNKQVNT
tara:strand:+ start:582 stop:776 length:195 start_codon:yes stop_codon:yes gene_type:complete